MSYSQIIKTKADGTILIEDGTGTPLTLTVAYETGDFNISIPGPTVSNFLDRSRFGSSPSLRYGDDQPVTFSFTANLRDIADASYITLESIITNSGIFASTWVSRGGANAEVKTVRVTFTIEGTTHGDSADHTIVMDHCVLTGSLQEGDPDSVSINGTAFIRWPTCT